MTKAFAPSKDHKHELTPWLRVHLLLVDSLSVQTHRSVALGYTQKVNSKNLC